MCFKNLPIEFDQGGKATLRQGVTEPYAVSVAAPPGYVRRQGRARRQLAAPPRLRDWNIDPMTRVAGAGTRGRSRPRRPVGLERVGRRLARTQRAEELPGGFGYRKLPHLVLSAR